MTQLREGQVPAGERLKYRAPEITDLGSVVELTEAGHGGTDVDGTTYDAPSPHHS